MATSSTTPTRMRVRPSLGVAILVILGYLAVVFGMWATTGLKYDDVGDTVENVRKGITLSIGVGAVYLVIVTSLLGWWKPAMREPRKVGGGWMWLIPVLLLLGAIANLAGTKWGRIDEVGSYVLWLGIGTLFVGFSEELLTRGLAIVGARGNLHERWVWVVSGLVFCLMHAPNALFGQSVTSTLQQMVFAFLVGMTYYVTRRIAGALIVTMALHAIWDFSIFIQAHSVDGMKDKPAALGGFVMYLVIILGAFAVHRILRSGGDVVEPGGDQLAAFDDAA
jgi:membrane protease YdiL (CAAX protease family)